MLRDGSPIYTLGSLQDISLQMLTIKEQQLRTKELSTMAQLIMFGVAAATHGDKEGKILKSINSILGDISLYEQYDEQAIREKEILQENHFKNMLSVVKQFDKFTNVNTKD